MTPTKDRVPTVPSTPDIDEKLRPDYANEAACIDHAAERALVRPSFQGMSDIRSGDST